MKNRVINFGLIINSNKFAMKKINFFASLFFFVTILVSCTKDDDQSVTAMSTTEIANRKNNSTKFFVTRPFVNRVLVEEYSGTWCGNCPNILYGTQLLHQQTNKEVSVQIHRGNDPFVTAAGNTIATEQNVVGVPTGKINRTINWTGPQYQNVNQVINEIKSSSNIGLAINSTLSTSGVINLNVVIGFTDISIQSKLVVYIVEDNLFHSQANYYSNLFGGQNPIPNFEYDGVLRSVVSLTSGDLLNLSGNQIQKNYSFSMPSNITTISNVKIVAFIIDDNTNSVLNVRQATLGESQLLERI